ncbi:MAG TPA: M1 family metallopeptidase [Patescibacteria group bacterium]|nr:M1 family metallopeptidase [Patescibacteria group bacterium]
MSTSVRRLFTGFKPTNYQLILDPDRESKKITGTVVITGQKAGRPSQRITLHQRGLKVTSATLTRHDKKGDQQFEVARINHHQSLDEVRLHSDALLYPGSYTITLTFEGRIQDSMHGVYLCNFKVGSKKQQLVATQFESTHAREAFPCIDEPEAKATFDLTLLSPKGEAVIGNMPAKSQSEKGGKLHTVFETSPKMSTYLLAFVYGNMHCKEAKTKGGVEVRVWASKAQPAAALEFPLEIATKAIDFFNDYYGVRYPLPNCNHVALPDFSVGAMENWGLITHRETTLLADPATTSVLSREYIAIVICHELSHQWFGNLVTMKWWDELWLNESFANVMEYVATDGLHPEWQMWNEFISREGLAAIRRDSIAGVQSVHTKVRHPDEIDSIFDPSIVYAKGGRLLNMLRNYIGEDDFRKGLTAYFAKHAYGNTTGDDLWAALGAAGGKDVAAFMRPWIGRPGFPVVSVSQKKTALGLRQDHFLLDPAKADKTRVWPVPTLSDTPGVPALLQTQTQQITLAKPDYVRLNEGAVGHYIVHYAEPAHAAYVAGLVSAKKLGIAERFMLLSDSGMLARGGQQPFEDTLKLLAHYEHEDQDAVWDIMSLTLADARRFIDADASLEEPMRALVRTLIQEQYGRLGWEEHKNEDTHDTKLRVAILGLGVYARYPQIMARAVQLFESYKKDATSVAAELRGIVFAAAVRAQVPGAFEYLIKLQETTQNGDLKQDSSGALTITEDKKQIAILVGRLTDSTKVRQQDLVLWVGMLLRSRYARAQAWEWLQSHWDWIEKTFAEDKSYDYFPRYAASAFNTAEMLEQYKAFFEPKQNQQILARNITMGIEEIENRMAWIKRDLAGVQSYFKS